jgi:hypothetical protein
MMCLDLFEASPQFSSDFLDLPRAPILLDSSPRGGFDGLDLPISIHEDEHLPAFFNVGLDRAVFDRPALYRGGLQDFHHRDPSFRLALEIFGQVVETE